MTHTGTSVILTRATTEADFAEVHAVAERFSQRVSGHATHLTAAELASELSAPGADPLSDFPLVTVADVPVAWGSVHARAPFTEIVMGYVIEPDLDLDVAQAVCTSLLGALDAAVARRVATLEPNPDRREGVVVHEREGVMLAVAKAHGFTFERQVLTMSIDQSVTPTSAPIWPEGISVRPLTSEDAAVVGDVSRDSFSEHQGDNDFSDEEVAHYLAEDDARLDVSLLAVDDHGPVGTVLCFDMTDGGYVGVLGVRSRGRGRGLGTALLRHAFHAFDADGRPVVRLHVEQDNTTGAVGVYESAGMRREYALQVWTRPA
jgi:ribosomal protein S18 acetylase RimI-like enzyme